MGQKKKFTVYLDIDLVAEARQYLKNHMGLELSQYLNMHLMQFVEVARGQPVKGDKKLADLTMQEYQDLINYWLRAVRKEEDE